MKTLALPPETQIVSSLGVANKTIADLKKRYTGMTAGTPAEYRAVKQAIADVKKVRVELEKSRKDLKADALEFGRLVDAEAGRIKAALIDIEEPLKLEKKRVDDAKEAERQAKIDAERQRIADELEAKRKAEEEIRLKAEAERKAEQDRIAAEQAAERARLDAERKAIEEAREKQEATERAAQAKRDAEQKEIDNARRKLEEEQRAADEAKERAEFERQSRIQAEKDAIAHQEAVERARIDKEAREHAEKMRASEQATIDRLAREAEAARPEALQPDAEKMRLLVEGIRRVRFPEMSTDEGRAMLKYADVALNECLDSITERIEAIEAAT